MRTGDRERARAWILTPCVVVDTAEAVSEETVEEIVRDIHAAFNRGDEEAFASFWSSDCEYQPAMERDLGGPSSYRGRSGIRRWWREMMETWEEPRSEVHEVRSAGDKVLVSITLHATGKASGAVVAAAFFQVGLIRDGKIVRGRDFADRAEALEDIGLPE
jgi:ketosteroid isomerase-like protein